MHKKINVDFFKNKLDKLPPVPLPKIKTRKIFSTKGPSECDPPPLPKVPPSTVVDRTPCQISTISSLVEGAPKYDYSFGGAEVPAEFIERHAKEDNFKKDNGGNETEKRSKGFSKLTKTYKELSELKFKNIFGKKTIVRKTEIQVDMYRQRYEEELEECSSEKSEYEFDVHSLPTGNERRISVATSSQSQESNQQQYLQQKAESFHSIDEISPNDSALYKIKRRAESTDAIASGTSTNITPQNSEENSNKPPHLRALDKARNKARKAKKAVNIKIQKLLHLKDKNIEEYSENPEENNPHLVRFKRKAAIKKRSSLPRNDSIESGRDSLQNSRESSVDYHPKKDWTSQRMLSTESKETPHCLKSQFSFESSDYERENIAVRPAPPIPSIPKPPKIESVSNRKIVIEFNKISPPLEQKNIGTDFLKGHSRKPSMDSIDSDSWIPEGFRNSKQQVVGLNKIEENMEQAWRVRSLDNMKKLKKTQSIDIFTGEESENAFEDFDDILKNVPVISIKNKIPSKDSIVSMDRPKRSTAPLVKQSSLSRQFSDEIEAENLNINVNKLISKFEPNDISKGERIKVIATVEKSRSQSIESSPEKTAKLVPQERLLRPWENSTSMEDLNIKSVKSETGPVRPITAKEWAQKVIAARSLGSTNQGSDDVFYSFESCNAANKNLSPNIVGGRRPVYRIEI